MKQPLDWMAPIDTQLPCGPSLEYDPEYAILVSKMSPKTETQLGTFVSTPGHPNWSEVEHECRRLLLRTKDITILLLYTRCRTRIAGAKGLLEGLSILKDWLDAYPEHINPPLLIDGEMDPAIRANALAMLADPEGLLGDAREIILVGNTALRLQIRDIERAFASPRPIDALSPDSVMQQLEELMLKEHATLKALIHCQEQLQSIQAWSEKHLLEAQPNLSAIHKLFQFVNRLKPMEELIGTFPEYPDAATEVSEALENISKPSLAFESGNHTDISQASHASDTENSGLPNPTSLSGHPDPRSQRKQALEHIRRARQWFEQHEPSSPVSILLNQAEHLVGKRFSELVKSIPLDLLHEWESMRHEELQG